MRFESKQDEYLYYAIKCERAKEDKNKEAYLYYLNKIKDLLPEIEKTIPMPKSN